MRNDFFFIHRQETEYPSTPVIRWIVYLVHFILILLAVVYAQERMLFADSAHLLFRMLNTQFFQVQAFRVGAMIPQFIPLTGIWIGLPLSVIVILYSVSIQLIYLLYTLILDRSLKQPGLALLYTLHLIVFTVYSFYWPTDDYFHGIGLFLIAISLPYFYKKRSAKSFRMVIGCFFIFSIALWTHPLILIVSATSLPLFIYLGYFKELNRKESTALLFTSLLAFSLKIAGLTQASYDEHLLNPLFSVSADSLHHMIHSAFFDNLFQALLSRYFVSLVLGLILIGLCLYSRRFILLSWVTVCIIAYLLVLGITYESVSDTFYLEYALAPLAFWIALPLIKPLTVLNKYVLLVGLILICSVKLFQITDASAYFSWRLTRLKEIQAILTRFNTRKAFVLDPRCRLICNMRLRWAVPEESLLLSAMQDDKPLCSFTLIASTESFVIQANKEELQLEAGKFAIHKLNPRYFEKDSLRVPYARIKIP